MRPSQYLLNKITNLRETLRFFSRSRGLAFLIQIDFWDWEFEELAYSLNNFAERRTAWTAHPDELKLTLRKAGYILDDKQVDQAAWGQYQISLQREWTQNPDGSWDSTVASREIPKEPSERMVRGRGLTRLL